jgi:polyisoprenoid-binding protein YceI
LKKLIIIFGIFLLSQISTIADTQNKIYNDKTKSTITYSMNHLLHSWSGVSSEVTAVVLADENTENISQVAVSTKVSTFDSDNANRDSHMLEVTEALKYPTVTFTSKSIENKGNKLIVNGTLQFHGVKHNISFDAYKSRNHNKSEIKGAFDIKMTDYKIEPPSLMGISTDDKIHIDFDVFF